MERSTASLRGRPRAGPPVPSALTRLPAGLTFDSVPLVALPRFCLVAAGARAPGPAPYDGPQPA
ncbi:hypothetical protein GCM10010365_32350 [Streptomyces poonensis]|uniref:Uncharacterized protein n=1 Tax=Streptomyces poonensis TaxID=68255 RepID=A0A918PI60_9ACTN|nr:hypothetical protein GCM10010365_32350 [Streptomyces poonensis]GLJ91398.1 hypothetical protein GCM10017589_40050 [Streptomyces poonensis]